MNKTMEMFLLWRGTVQDYALWRALDAWTIKLEEILSYRARGVFSANTINLKGE